MADGVERAREADVLVTGEGVAALAAVTSLRGRGVDAVFAAEPRVPTGLLVWDAARAGVTRLANALRLDVQRVSPDAATLFSLRDGVLRAPRTLRLLDVIGRGRELRALPAGFAPALRAPAVPVVSNAQGRVTCAPSSMQSPLVLVSWRERAPGEARLPRGLGWIADEREHAFARAMLFASDVEGAPEGEPRRFVAFVGGRRAPDRARLRDEEIVRVLGEELRRIGGVLGEVVGVERVDDACVSSLFGGTLEDALEAGLRAADDALASLARLPAPPSSAPVAAPPPTSPPAPAPAPSAKATGSALVVVGASYREASTDVRARLAALEKTDDAPSRALVKAGYADGVVVLETCSRIEWVVSSSKPQWAAEILKSTLGMRAPEARLHVKTGHAGAHYLLRLAMGLDSVAEGEPAVGRQLVLAFERAHKEGAADRALRLSWRAVQQLLGDRRRRGVVQHGLGVQTLVLEELAARGVDKNAPLLVFGLGEIGRAVVNALREAGYTSVDGHRRATHELFHEAAKTARAVVVCTGGPAPFLDLPARDDERGLVVDIGVPEQVRAAPGWTRVALEELLARPRRLLDDDTRAWLVDQVADAATKLTKDLAAPPPITALSAIDEERRVFLRETLPPLLEKLPPATAEEVRRACATFAHHLMERVREGGGA